MNPTHLPDFEPTSLDLRPGDAAPVEARPRYPRSAGRVAFAERRILAPREIR